MICIFACGEAEDPIEPEPEPEQPVVLEYGTVSGTITDAGNWESYSGGNCKTVRVIS